MIVLLCPLARRATANRVLAKVVPRSGANVKWATRVDFDGRADRGRNEVPGREYASVVRYETEYCAVLVRPEVNAAMKRCRSSTANRGTMTDRRRSSSIAARDQDEAAICLQGSWHQPGGKRAILSEAERAQAIVNLQLGQVFPARFIALGIAGP